MNYTADPLIKVGLRPDYSEAFNEMNNAIAGIATTSSSFWEANNGGIRYQGHIAVGQGSVDTISPLTAMTGTLSAGTNNYDSFTNGSLTQNALVLNSMHIDATANNAANWIAQNGLAEIKSGNNKNYTGLVAGDGGAVYHYGTGTVTEFDGVFALTQNNSSGTITNAQGVRALGLHYGSGTVTNDYGVSSLLIQISGSNTVTTHHGVHISNPVLFAGTVGTNVGLYVENHTSGTTDYNIYSAGSGSTNFFEGNVNVGSASSKVSINNSALGSTSLDVFSSAAGAVAVFQGNGQINGGILVGYTVGNSVTGSVYGYKVSGSVTDNLYATVQQNGNGNAVHEGLVLGTGDAYALYNINGGAAWSVGLDNSDSDAFVISNHGTLGTSNALRFDTSENATLYGDVTMTDAKNFIFNATTGTKIATATSQKLGFWNATPIVQPTTGVAAATFTANTSGIANDTATFDGYTIGQVVKALRNTGILA